MALKKKIYCSLDIEGTGLDPKKDEIIELGAVLFEIDAKGKIAFGETFSQLIKPPIPIPPFIQNLTHITEQDVADAPPWEEIRPAFKKFVGKHVIVGQNIQFDLNFLSAHGLSFEQKAIDTKDLAAMLLPEIRMYNLEFLLRYFKVPLDSHHRALADSRSAALLLEQLIATFHNLPLAIQSQAGKLLAGSSLAYKGLFQPPTTHPGKKSPQPSLFDVPVSPPATPSETPSDIDVSAMFGSQGRQLVSLPMRQIRAATLKKIISQTSKQKGGCVISVKDHQRLVEAKASLPTRGDWMILDEPEIYFCPVRFREFSGLAVYSDRQVQFLIKILVWLATKKTEDDLSLLSFNGDEYDFRKFICGDFAVCREHSSADGCALGELLSDTKTPAKILTHHSALFELLADEPSASFERVIFWDSAELENVLARNSTGVVTLRSARAPILGLYDPQNSSGYLKNVPANLKRSFEEVLNETDLFFGLLGIEFSKLKFEASQLLAENGLRESSEFQKASIAAMHLLEIIAALEAQVAKIEHPLSGEVKKILSQLAEQGIRLDEFFLHPSADKLYWLDLYGQQIKIKSRRRQVSFPSGQFNSCSFIGSFAVPEVRAFYANLFSTKEHLQLTEGGEKAHIQIFLPEDFPAPSHPRSTSAMRDFLQQLLPRLEGRTVVVFNSQKALESVYEAMDTAEVRSRLLVQKFTGHHWKNFEQYQNNDQAIWFLTAANFLERLSQLPPTRQLIITRIPFEAPGIFEGLYDRQKLFRDYIIPKTAAKMEQIFIRFISAGETNVDKKKIIFLDPRIAEDYNHPLLAALCDQLTVENTEFDERSWEKVAGRD